MLGLIMSNRGLALAGMNISPMAIMSSAGAFGDANASSSSSDEIKATIKDGVQVLNMTANVYGYTPKTLYVKRECRLNGLLMVKKLLAVIIRL